MSTVAFIRRMLDAGFTHDDALRAAEAFEATAVEMIPEPVEEKSGAARTRRWRERRASQTVTERHEASPNVTTSQCDAGSPSLPSSPQTPQQPTHPPVEITTRVKAGPKPSKRCPAAWEPSPEDLAAEPQLTAGEIERELAKFRDHTFGTARSDWSATFRNWIRRAAERTPRNARSDPGTIRADQRSQWADIIAERAAPPTGDGSSLRLAG